jgi:hypothetical protein
MRDDVIEGFPKPYQAFFRDPRFLKLTRRKCDGHGEALPEYTVLAF